MTGMNPGKHGIIDFVHRRQGSYRISPVTASDRKARSLWAIAGAAGRRVGVMNVPVTYPPEPVNGFMITGLLTPSLNARYTYPPELATELDAEVGGYRIHLKPTYSQGGMDEFLDDLEVLTHKQVTATQYLMRKHEWDLFTVVYRGPDGVQHALWHATDPAHPLYSRRHGERYGGGILDNYRRMDAHLAELISLLDEDTTLVLMSDHGAGPLHQFIYVNNWLLKWGFMHTRRSLASRLRWLLFRMGLAPVEIYDVLLRLRLGFVKGAVTKGKNRGLLTSLFLSFTDVDWTRTTAYAVGNGGQIYVNLRGREPQGIVEPGAEYERVVGQIIDHVNEMTDPRTGERIPVDVYRRDEVYSGDHLDLMPDVVFLPRDLKRMPFGEYEFGSHRLIGPARSISGTHRMNGILMLWGAGIAPGRKLDGGHIVDVAPTVLALMGLEIPSDMDGQVLDEAFLDGAVPPIRISNAGDADRRGHDQEPGDREADLSKEEEQEIAERLRGLGYVG
jgi:predicted AlkP superfamily phosphohydrolase/phosphomutase